MSVATEEKSELRRIVPSRFNNGDEFLHNLGDVPMSRVVFDPWPGTATEQDLLQLVERDNLGRLLNCGRNPSESCAIVSGVR